MTLFDLFDLANWKEAHSQGHDDLLVAWDALALPYQPERWAAAYRVLTEVQGESTRQQLRFIPVGSMEYYLWSRAYDDWENRVLNELQAVVGEVWLEAWYNDAIQTLIMPAWTRAHTQTCVSLEVQRMRTMTERAFRNPRRANTLRYLLYGLVSTDDNFQQLEQGPPPYALPLRTGHDLIAWVQFRCTLMIFSWLKGEPCPFLCGRREPPLPLTELIDA